jgi:hypothetical protein
MSAALPLPPAVLHFVPFRSSSPFLLLLWWRLLARGHVVIRLLLCHSRQQTSAVLAVLVL